MLFKGAYTGVGPHLASVISQTDPHDRNLKVALELVNIVADSRYKLYDDFLHPDGRRLAEYLGAVRQAVLVGLENGGSDPFKVVSS